MGKHELRLLRYSLRFYYPDSWHPYGKDRSTIEALHRLEAKELITIDRSNRKWQLALNKKDLSNEN
jgi:hypothetical protein